MKSISDYATEFQNEINQTSSNSGNSNKKHQLIEHNLTSINFGKITNFIIKLISDNLSISNLQKFFPIDLENLKPKLNKTPGYTSDDYKKLSREICNILKLSHFGEIARLSTINGVNEQKLVKELNSRLNNIKDEILNKYQHEDINQKINITDQELDDISEKIRHTLSFEIMHASLPKAITKSQLEFAYNLGVVHGEQAQNLAPVINTGGEKANQVNKKNKKNQEEKIEKKREEDEEPEDELGDDLDGNANNHANQGGHIGMMQNTSHAIDINQEEFKEPESPVNTRLTQKNTAKWVSDFSNPLLDKSNNIGDMSPAISSSQIKLEATTFISLNSPAGSANASPLVCLH